MRFRIDKKSNFSYCEQVKMQIVMLLMLGEIDDGQRLPSIRQLAKDMDINQKTAVKIYRKLEKDGLLEIIPGSGVYVDAFNEKKHKEYFRAAVFQYLQKFFTYGAQLGLTLESLIKVLTTLENKNLFSAVTVGFVDTLQEELEIYSQEIRNKVGAKCELFMLDELNNPNQKTKDKINNVDCFVTTNLHKKEVEREIKKYNKELFIVKCFLNRLDFIFKGKVFKKLGVVFKYRESARRGKHYAKSLLLLKPFLNIKVASIDDSDEVRKIIDFADILAISPLCLDKMEKFNIDWEKVVEFDYYLEPKSIEKLKSDLMIDYLNVLNNKKSKRA